MDWKAVSAELQKPLDKQHVKPPKQYGPKGSYIEAWHAQAEANRIFGFGGWEQKVTETTCVSQAERPIGKDKKPGWGVTYTAKVQIAVHGVAREDFGAGHGYDVDLGLAHESAIKEAVSDAMKRALKSFGNPFGLALYDKTQANVADTADIEAQARAESEAQRIIANIQTCESLEELAGMWPNIAKPVQARGDVIAAKDQRKAELSQDTAKLLAGG